MRFQLLSNRIESHFQNCRDSFKRNGVSGGSLDSKQEMNFFCSRYLILFAIFDDTSLFRLMICLWPKSIPYWNIGARDIFRNGYVYTNLECCLRCLMRFTINDFVVQRVLRVLNDGYMWWLSLFADHDKMTHIAKKGCMVSNSCMYMYTP